MEYRPIDTRWVVLTLSILVVLGALCKVAAGDGFQFPRVLWLIPSVVLDGVGITVAGFLVARFHKWRRAQREGDS